MALKRYKRVSPAGRDAVTPREYVEGQLRLEEVLGIIQSKEILDGRLIEDVALEPFVDNVIEHGLGRKLRGYEVVKHEAVLADFHAKLSANQDIETGGSGEIAAFATVDYDDGGNYSNTTYTFTAPVDGFYWFEHAGYLTAAAAGYFDCFLRINGIAFGDQMLLNSSANGVAVRGHGRFRLDAGDEVAMHAYQNSGGTEELQAVGDSRYSYLKGGLVDEGITDRQLTLTSDEQAETLILRCSYAQTVSLWVF